MITDKAIRFLLIDDDDVNNFLTKEFLKLYVPNAITAEAVSGQAGIDYLQSLVNSLDILPEIILLDINMPVMDGWDFLDAFEQLNYPAKSSIRIFMYTSSVYHEDFEKAKTYASVSNIFSKPLDQAKIQEMVASLA